MKTISTLLFLAMVFFSRAQTLSVTIEADKMVGCPGNDIHLSANVTGASQPDSLLDYEWSFSGKGSFAYTDKDSAIFLLADSGDAQIHLKLRDGSDSAVGEKEIKNAWLKLDLFALDDSIDCNTSTTLIAYTRGSIAGVYGRSYLWSNDATSASITAIRSGVYAVTVANSTGCSVSDSLEIFYTDGVYNLVDFEVPYPICQNCPAYFKNISEKKDNPWLSHWDFFTNGDPLIFNQSAFWTYTNPGYYSIQLNMDSAGCRFSVRKLIQVLPQSNPLCVAQCFWGIEENQTNKFIRLSPNPSGGRLKIAASDDLYPLQMSVHTILGAKAADFQITNAEQELDLSALLDGIYFLRFHSIHQKEKPVVKRLVISR